MFSLRKFITENRLTSVSRFDEATSKHCQSCPSGNAEDGSDYCRQCNADLEEGLHEAEGQPITLPAGRAGHPMTEPEKQRVISRIQQWPRPQLVQALRAAAKNAHKDARSADLVKIFQFYLQGDN